MKPLPVAAATIALLSTSACGPPADLTANTAEEAAKPIDGYGVLKLGMSFEDAIASLPSDLIDASDCYDDLAIKGCFLSSGKRPFTMVLGIPYTLVMNFNRDDQLVDFGLWYGNGKTINSEDCLRIFERTLDWVARDFGPLVTRVDNNEEGWTTEHRQTEGGNSFAIGRNNEGNWVIVPNRTYPTSKPQPQEANISKWDNNRYVTVHAFQIGTVEDNCHVAVDFEEAPKVRREPMGKDD